MPSVEDVRTTVEDVLEFLWNRSNGDEQCKSGPITLLVQVK